MLSIASLIREMKVYHRRLTPSFLEQVRITHNRLQPAPAVQPNKALQLTRAGCGAPQDRRYFDSISDLSMLYPGAGN